MNGSQAALQIPANTKARATLVRAGLLFGLLGALLAGANPAAANDFYVSPTGSSSGDGSLAKPWNLQTALNQPSAVKPGDTIWLQGGTYSGTFTSSLAGTSSQPIVVRNYSGERATLDGGNSNGTAVLTIGGSYTWFWGLEIMSSDPNRVTTQTGSWPSDIGRGDGVDGNTAVGIKFINLVIHDTRQGFSLFSQTTNTEVYGCLIYYNGWNSPDGGQGHGIYTQNTAPSTRVYHDNVVFQNFGLNIQAYGSGNASLDNFDFTGNSIFRAGQIAASPHQDILVGGGKAATNPLVISNSIFDPGGAGSAFEIGYTYGSGTTNARVQNNYVGAGALFYQNTNMTLTGNTFAYGTSGLNQTSYPNNTYLTSPVGTQVFLRPNAYESGRATITIFNWNSNSTVAVDVSSVLSAGASYELRNAQNFYGPPVMSGTYTGGALQIPMTGLTAAKPVGYATPASTSPQFNVFILLQTGSPSGCNPAYGDLNQDGAVNATDLVILSNYLAGNLTQGPPPFTASMSYADLDRSGSVTAVDLVILQNYLVGNIACLPK
jgi:Dockerin type I domain